MALERDKLPDRVNEALIKYEPKLDFKGGNYFEVRAKILKELPAEFAPRISSNIFPMLKKRFCAGPWLTWSEKDIFRLQAPENPAAGPEHPSHQIKRGYDTHFPIF